MAPNLGDLAAARNSYFMRMREYFIETANAQAAAEIDFAVEAFDWSERRRFWISPRRERGGRARWCARGTLLGAG